MTGCRKTSGLVFLPLPGWESTMSFAAVFARRFGALLAGSCFLLCGLAAAEGEWHVKEAALRFELDLAAAPNHPAAGYFAHIPDGGILPGPFPVTTVFAEIGGAYREVASYQLWHNAKTELTIVFADPGSAKKALVYVSGENAPRLWSPEAELAPSALLCTDPTRADLGAAAGLGKLGPVGPTVHTVNKAGIDRAPFSVGGDDSGRPMPGSFYLLAHVLTTDPGKTWIAPFTVAGETEVRIDGQKLVPKKRNDKWGGAGDWVTLEKGLHRIEVFQTAPGTEPYSTHRNQGGLMYLTWRTPKDDKEKPDEEIAQRRRRERKPVIGPKVETRLLEEEEIVRSGSCSITGALTREGGPVACAVIEPRNVFWFEEELPLVGYRFSAFPYPADTSYTWTFPGGGKVDRATAHWLFPGFTEQEVTLTVKNSLGTSRAVRPFYTFSTLETRLEDPDTRAAYRDAFTEMLQALPSAIPGRDPFARFEPAYWNNLMRTIELGKSLDLLANLILERRNLIRKTLSDEDQLKLENLFLDMVIRGDPKKAGQIIDHMIANAYAERRDQLQIWKAELLMYYTGELEKAKNGLTQIASASGDIAELARIRLGDIAFLGGDLNTATKYYADVQNRAREKRNQAPVRKSAEPADPADPKMAPDAPEWNVGALLDVSHSENVATLVSDGYLLEAREALAAWEREYPLSKISGDFLIKEARYHRARQDWPRVRVLVEAYCREFDASSFLPDAARLLVEAVTQMKGSPDEVRKVLDKVKGNLMYHPVAQEIDAFLSPKK